MRAATDRCAEDDGVCTTNNVSFLGGNGGGRTVGAGVYAHHFAEIRLYCWPMRRMIWPRMTKLAAMRGVGAMIVGGSCTGGGLTTVPGFAGSDGCRGGVATGAGTGVGCVEGRPSGAGVPGVGAGAGDGAADAAATAFARACAIRSAVLASCFFRISMRASSCLIFLTARARKAGALVRPLYRLHTFWSDKKPGSPAPRHLRPYGACSYLG